METQQGWRVNALFVTNSISKSDFSLIPQSMHHKVWVNNETNTRFFGFVTEREFTELMGRLGFRTRPYPEVAVSDNIIEESWVLFDPIKNTSDEGPYSWEKYQSIKWSSKLEDVGVNVYQASAPSLLY